MERVESALRQLYNCGNLQAHPDTTDVSTVENFFRPRSLCQLTVEGDAAERSVAFYEYLIAGELTAAALGDLRELLGELEVLANSSEPGSGKVHRTLTKQLQWMEKGMLNVVGDFQRIWRKAVGQLDSVATFPGPVATMVESEVNL
jgi:hypothetical protein